MNDLVHVSDWVDIILNNLYLKISDDIEERYEQQYFFWLGDQTITLNFELK